MKSMLLMVLVAAFSLDAYALQFTEHTCSSQLRLLRGPVPEGGVDEVCLLDLMDSSGRHLSRGVSVKNDYGQTIYSLSHGMGETYSRGQLVEVLYDATVVAITSREGRVEQVFGSPAGKVEIHFYRESNFGNHKVRSIKMENIEATHFDGREVKINFQEPL